MILPQRGPHGMVLTVLLLIAIALLALHFWSRLSVRRAEAKFPPAGQYVTVEGVRLHYLVRGEGPPMVMVHGVFGASQDFTATVLNDAARRHRVWVFDRPGHGYSERPREARPVTPEVQARLLRGALRQLGVEPPLLVGFSYGAAVVLAHALAYPQESAGVLLINGATHPWSGGAEAAYTAVELPLLGALFLHTGLMPVARLSAWVSINRAFDPLPAPPEFERFSPLALALRPASFLANARDIRGLKDFLRGQSTRYGELKLPVVILSGDGDWIVSPQVHSAALHFQVPHSEWRRVAEAGHHLLYTHPAEVLDALAALVALSGRVQHDPRPAPQHGLAT